jgi:hypothetical protein
LDLEYLDKPKKSTTLPRSEAKTAPNNLYDDAPFDDQDDNHLNAGNNFFISPEKVQLAFEKKSILSALIISVCRRWEV